MSSAIPFYRHLNGELWLGDAVQWLRSLPPHSVDLIVADPPYNLKKAEWDNFASQQHYVEWSLSWIEPAAKLLKPTGSLYICGFSETLADLKLPALRYFAGCRWLIWHYKNKANLANDWGRSHESILHLRMNKFKLNIDNIRICYGNHTLKYPEHPQAVTSQYAKSKQVNTANWQPHPKGAKPRDVIEIPTTCNGMPEKTKHPTQKPEALMRKLVMAASYRGDTIVDPFIGSGTTLVVAEQLGRKWMGCELNVEYAHWATDRIERARQMSDEEWFWFDRKNELQRKKIR